MGIEPSVTTEVQGSGAAPESSTSITEPAGTWQRVCPWLAVVVSAVLVTVCFPRYNLGWLAWIAYAPLFWAIGRARRPRSAAGMAYVFGVIHFAALTPWIGVTVNAWSGTRLGWIAWVLLAVIQGLWFALFGWLAWWVRRRTGGDARLILTACAWTFVEYLRTLGALAMPWGLAAYTQYRAATLIQISDITGAFGVSFVIALVNAGLAELLSVAPAAESERRRRSVIRLGRIQADIGVLVLPCLFYAGLLSYGSLTVGLPWGGRPVVVAAVQTNIPSIGPQPPRSIHLGRLSTAVDSVVKDAPSLTIWPESAAPGDVARDLDLRAVFGAFAQRTTGYHLVGTSCKGEDGRERNSAALFAPDEGLVGRYDKQQLVPFGEWVPARWLFRPFAAAFRIPEEDLASGGVQEPLTAREMKLGVLICYESIFPALSRDRVRRGANLLVSITNDSWAGDSASPQQHFAMTLFRAVETRRSVCASGLTGVTALIAPNGRTMVAEENVPAVVSDLVYLRQGLTPYVRWGDWLPWLCAVLVAYGLWKGSPQSEEPSRTG